MNNSRDPFGVWNGEKFEFTLKKLCDIIFNGRKYTMPKAFVSIQDKVIDRVTADTMPATKGHRVVFDLSWNVAEEDSRKKILGYLKSGVIVVSNRSFTDNGKNYPVIRIRDVWEAWINLGKYVKGVFPMPTIGLTGSAGKTTSTMFAECVFNERYKTFVSGLNGRNFNTTLQIVNQWILRIDPSYTFHVQECGAETIDLIKSSAQVLDVDGFGITNIDTSQHIATYEKAENLIADKTSFDRVRKEDTFGVINLDDEILKNFQFKSPVITFAINDESADYVGKNIVQNGELLEFDVVSKEETVHIRIHIVGNHNVYNALMVFAFAKKFGLTNEEIQNGFWKYESVGIRQYLRRVGGRLLYMDAYNASVESTQLCIETLQNMQISEHSKKIAIVGERKTSNEETYEINYNLGKSLAQYDGIDEFIIVGEDPKRLTGKREIIENEKYGHALYDGACSVLGDTEKVSYCNDLSNLAYKIKCQTKPGDAILFKGRYHLSLWSVADLAFGTGYTKTDALSPLGVTKNIVSTKSIKGEYYPCLNGINLLSATNGIDNTKIILPALINGSYIVRIGDNAFANKSQLKMFVFGFLVKSIGDCAFINCVNLDQLELPKSCCYIGFSSFEGCKSLVRASLPGVAHISKAAFKDCINLKQVLLTEKCATIEEDAFENCDNLTICAPEDSYAANWAKENGVSLEIIDSEEELEKLAKNGTRLNPNIYALERYEAEEEIDKASDETENKKIANLSVITAGDIMIHSAHLNSCFDKTTGVYSFGKLFANTKKYFKSADLAIGNVETVFGPGKATGFPRFNTPDELAECLAEAGLDISTSANNHIFDVKYAGIVRTRHILESYGIDVAGIRSNENEKAYVIAERKGIKIALINFTYRTQSSNGVKTINTRPLDAESEKLVNTFCFETLDEDLEKVETEIKCAKDEGADIILVYYHWGSEYETKSNILQKYIAYKTAEMGADAILGSHAHVLQEISKVTVDFNGKKKDVPVFYGLGNYSWASRLPRTGRETVHNGALAKLDIEYDKEKKEIVSIKTDYVPLYIKTDYIYNKFDFNILSLRDMDEADIDSFNLRSSKTVQQISDEIEETLNGDNSKDSSEFKFDKVIEIPVGKRISLSDTVFVDEKFVSLRSENAPVASVLQSLEIIANSAGFAGIAAEQEDGRKAYFIVKVVGRGQGETPVLVDEYNMVPDIYRPKNLVSGVKYGLPSAVSLEKNSAEAWLAMKTSAAFDKVYMYCTSGYRSNELQLRKIVSVTEEFGIETAENRLMPVGYTEHHLGIALDVSNVASKGSSTDDVFNWLEENTSKFGFCIRKSEDEAHLHLWYVGNAILAKLIMQDNTDRRQYIKNYQDYKRRMLEDEDRSWMHNYLPEDEISAPTEEWDKLTLKRICDIIGIDVPLMYENIQNRIVPKVTLSDLHTELGSIFFYDKILKNSHYKARNAFRNGAALAITDTPLSGENGKLLPQINVNDSFDAAVKMGQYFRRKSNAKVVAIAENNKRILRDILLDMISSEYSVHKNESDVDNRINTLETIQTLLPEHQIYLQNILHVLPGYMKKNAEMLLPNIAVATKVKVKYPALYKLPYEYKADRCSVLDVTLENGGKVFIDIDEPLYEEYIGMPNVVTYSSSKNKKADYYILKTVQKKNASEITLKYSKYGTKCETKISSEHNQSLDYVIAAIAVSDALK